MMELKISGADLQTLAEKGLLNDLIKNCTVAGPEAAEEEPKKKATRKKATKKEEKTDNPTQTISEPVASEAVTPVVAHTDAVPEPVKEEAFSLEGLKQKAIGLMDAGKGPQLQALLQQFGVNSLPDLQPEQYGGFYAALTEMEG